MARRTRGGGWKLVRQHRINMGSGVTMNIGGGLLPRLSSFSFRLLKGVTWNSRGSLSVKILNGLKAVRKTRGLH